MPDKEKYFLNRCKEINPDFEHILWTNKNLPILPEKVQAHCDYFTAKKDYAFDKVLSFAQEMEQRYQKLREETCPDY